MAIARDGDRVVGMARLLSDGGLGYAHQPAFMSAVVGTWLDNEANRGQAPVAPFAAGRGRRS